MPNLPNALSALRIALAPALVALAWLGLASWFLAALAAALISDALDGAAARRLGVSSSLGAQLDSAGDLLIWGVLPLGAWWLWPDAVSGQAPWVALVLVAFSVPTLVGLARYGRPTSFHTRSAKASAIAMGPAVLLLVVGGIAWPFHAASVLLTLSALEELAITGVLPRWRSDVPSLCHALRLRSLELASGLPLEVIEARPLAAPGARLAERAASREDCGR